MIGPNGAGKSTLIKAILGLAPRDSGEMTLNGQPVAQQRRAIAYMPQRSEIDWDYPAIVRDVVMMGRYPAAGLFGRLRRADRMLVESAIERVHLADLAQHPIGELSGGQQQRVFLARALAQDADMFLLDEPFSAVDAHTESVLWDVLRGLRDQGRTVVVVNHDLGSVSRNYDQLLVLAGRVVACGPVGEVFQDDVLAAAYGSAPCGVLAPLSNSPATGTYG